LLLWIKRSSVDGGCAAGLQGRAGAAAALHTRFKKGQSGNPRGARARQLSALLAEALDEKTDVTIGSVRRRMTKREAIVAQIVEKSAAADLRALKLLLDMQKAAERQAGVAPAAGEPDPNEADEKVIDSFIRRLRFAEEDDRTGRATAAPDDAADRGC
jgi:DNA-binding response OmpR family regulator